mgnify:FL=1
MKSSEDWGMNDVGETAEDLLAYSMDTLITMRELWKAQAKTAYAWAGKAEFEILRRLQKDGATVYVSEEWEAKAMPGKKSYTYNMAWLIQLPPLLQKGEWDKLVSYAPAEPVVDKVQLNTLAKRGGLIAEIIATAVVTTEGRPWLEVKKSVHASEED